MSQIINAGRHIGIPVLNLDIMISFYVNLLGFKIKSNEIEQGDFISHILGVDNCKIHVVKMIAPDGWMLELLLYLNINRGESKKDLKMIYDLGNAHIALTVTNIDEAYNYLKLNNIKFISLPKLSSSGKAKVCFCQDPEGNYIELVEILI